MVRIALAICLLAATVPANAQAPSPQASATQRVPTIQERRARAPFPIPAATGPITVDGAVTEGQWETALKLELNYEVRPGENTPPPVRTEVFLVYDDRALYVAFKAYDNTPSAIRARYRDRDNAFNDDWVGILLDTFNDERRAYEFFSNPLGVQMDMFMDDVSGNEDNAWNAIWESKGRITETGYEVEFAIPFTQLRFQTTAGAQPQTWGIDLMRSYPRVNRHHITLFPRIRGENSYLGQEEKVSGFAGIRAGQNLEIVPTVTTVRSDARADFPRGQMRNTRADGDFGLTTKWGITPNVTFNATFNPDFSQVEADAVQLDLNTQFALFFNETRPFFLENADFFVTPRLQLLHTRQIVQPNGAVKLTGKTGRHAFGFFAAQDGATGVILPGFESSRTRLLEDDTLASVGRYRFDVGSNSTVGAMITDRRGGDYFNNVISIDGRHRFSTADSIQGTLAFSSVQDAASIAALTSAGRRTDIATEVHFDHSVRNWNAYTNFRERGKDFRSDLGFITQVDIRRFEYGGARTWQGDGDKFYSRMQISGNFDQTERTDRALIERELEGYFSLNSKRESFMQFGGGRRTYVFNGVRFDQRFQSVFAEMRASANLFFGSNVNWGEWIDFSHTRPADQLQMRPFVNANLGRHLAIQYSHQINRLKVEGGELFLAQVPEMRINYQRDTRTMFRAILQYTNVGRDPLLFVNPVASENRDLFAQLLFSYKVNPQTAMYVGYVSGASGTDEFAMTHANQTLFAKFSYAWLR
jgi:hypothetical protein